MFKKKSPKPVFATKQDDLAALGITNEVKLFEDGFRTNKDRGYFEWWYFDAHLDDQTTVVVVFMTKSLTNHNGPLKPGMMITVNRPDGSKVFKGASYAKELFSASEKQCDVKIGTNSIKGDLKEYEMHAVIDDVEVDLTFTGTVTPWRPGEGKIYFGDKNHFFGWVAPIPHGKVKGTLVYDGKTHQVQGTGYHDHNWGNLSLSSVQDHWYWGRTTIDDFTVLYVEQTTTKKYGSKKLPVFLLAKGDKILIEDGEPLTLDLSDFTKHPSGHKYPNKLIFKWEKGKDQVVITLKNPKVIEATSLLSTLPKWQQKLANIFINPYYFRFNAELELKINYGDLQTVKTGSTLYELMQLK